MKKIKDPIYGYIEIDDIIFTNIIDTPTFQRLRRINQTSFAPLYPSAMHNRFVHSLGVYHLGHFLSSSLKIKLKNRSEILEIINESELDRYIELFDLACLLHDVGHAPFSHTGESHFLCDGDDQYLLLHNKLSEVVGTESLEDDIPRKSGAAAPHEIISAIIGIEEFSSLIEKKEEAEFFARCITGYLYSKDTKKNQIKNCLITLLNSKIIDVDKLDYLVRDAYVTGYNSVNLDYERLLSAVTIVQCKTGNKSKYEVVFERSAISIIENVVFAHDGEKKWIQGHPVILYENNILKHIMNKLADTLDNDQGKLFSLEALSEDGVQLNNHEYIRLLSDDDIIYLMKKYLYQDATVIEYFDRNKRWHSLWKSDAEYMAYFSDMGEGILHNCLIESLELTEKYLEKNSSKFVINDEVKHSLEQEIQEIKDAYIKIGEDSIEFMKEQLDEQLQSKTKILTIVNAIVEFSAEIGYNGDFILIKRSQFNSNFGNSDYSMIKVLLKDGCNPRLFKDIVSTYDRLSRKKECNFFLYYDRSKMNDRSNINIQKLANSINKALIDITHSQA